MIRCYCPGVISELLTMKKLILPVLAALVLVGFTGVSYVSAAAYDYHFSAQDSMDSPTVVDAAPSAYMTSFLAHDHTNNAPAFYYTDGVQFVFDDINHNVSIGTIQTSQVAGLDAALTGYTSRLDGDDTTLTSQASTLSTLSSTQSSQASSISTFNAFKNAYSGANPITFYVNNATTTAMKRLLFNGTTTSGITTFYLTTDGTSSGTALCPTAIGHVNVIANDPSNTFGIGWALTNSNKTLTVTANTRSFTTTTILGISVLGSSALASATNGTSIWASVDCN